MDHRIPDACSLTLPPLMVLPMADLVRDNVISQLHRRIAGHDSLHALHMESISFPRSILTGEVL